jgi:hypothetical protein
VTPDALEDAVDAAWSDAVAALESGNGSNVAWNQSDLARAVASGIALRLGAPLIESRARRAMLRRPRLRLDVGDAELAEPARVWLSAGDGAPEAEIARLRWLPRNLYRAMGFLLHLRGDCAQLARARQCEHSALPAWVCLVDTVGVADDRTAGSLVRGAPRIRVLGWSSRAGRLTLP